MSNYNKSRELVGAQLLRRLGYYPSSKREAVR
jgi:hypothetical protein